MLCTPVNYAECDCEKHTRRPYLKLTTLILDCWQREYYARPYDNFNINRTLFERHMKRVFFEEDWKVLIEFLNGRKLKSVSISYIPFFTLDDENLVKNLVKGLLNVEKIKLRSVNFPVAFLAELRKKISIAKVISLDLRENVLTGDHLILLQGILVDSFTLSFLDVGSCFLNDQTFPILADGIHKSKSLKAVDFSRVCPMSFVSIFDCSKFVNLVTSLIWRNQLTELHLQHCHLNGHDMECLSEYLAEKSSILVHLDLQGNNITSHGTEYLFRALVASQTMEVLNLSSNNVGSAGGMVIARCIANTKLTSLDVTHNQIGSEAMYELMCAIKKSCELKHLQIHGNKFDSNSAAVLKRLLIAKVLQKCDVDLTYTRDHSNNELRVITLFSGGRIRD